MKPKLSPPYNGEDAAWLTLSDSHMTFWQVGVGLRICSKSSSDKALCELLSLFFNANGRATTAS